MYVVYFNSYSYKNVFSWRGKKDMPNQSFILKICTLLFELSSPMGIFRQLFSNFFIRNQIDRNGEGGQQVVRLYSCDHLTNLYFSFSSLFFVIGNFFSCLKRKRYIWLDRTEEKECAILSLTKNVNTESAFLISIWYQTVSKCMSLLFFLSLSSWKKTQSIKLSK